MFYKVVMNGSFQGQDIRNILYYRTGIGVDVSQLGLSGAVQLANALTGTFTNLWLAAMDEQYMLDSLDVYPYNENFSLVYQNPYHMQIAEAGTHSSSTPGPSVCVNMVFQLEAVNILQNGIKPPKRGYIALGPIDRNWINEQGFLLPTIITDNLHPLNVLRVALSQDVAVTLPVPCTFWPIRMKQKRTIVDNLIPFESYADVHDCVLDKRISFRRSRMPERQ